MGKTKQKLMNYVKCSKIIYSIYYFVMNLFLRLLSCFLKPSDNIILFNSFGGKKYDDSPKAIYEMMKEDSRFNEYRFVWAFHDIKQFHIDGAEMVKTDTLKYFVTALRARVWITNSSIERGLHFKRETTFCLNTWHGSPIKNMGTDMEGANKSMILKTYSSVDIMNAQSRFDADVFSGCFGIPRESFLECGLPRNDVLCLDTREMREKYKKMLGINPDKKVILYCPTFREFDRDSSFGCVLHPPMDLKKWKRRLGENYVLLFRAHYEVYKAMDIREDSFVLNMTSYPSLNELMIAADILISDYSSVFFDYALMDKCMFHFTYDYEDYVKNRGMYFDIRDYISGCNDEDGLIDILLNLDEEKEVSKTKEFRSKFVNFYGNATQKTVDCIAAHIG